jgi:hypothetical protein
MPVTINGTTGITTPDLDSTADISANGVNFGEGGGSVAANTAAGNGALAANTVANFNTAVGHQALNVSNRTSDVNGNNTATGYRAGFSNVTGQSNSFYGAYSGLNSTGSNNTYIGQYASGVQTSGSFNTYVGSDSGSAMTTASDATIVGRWGGQGYLDCRTRSKTTALSDGNGNPSYWSVPGVCQYLFRPDVANSTGLAINTNNSKGGTVTLLSNAQLWPVGPYFGGSATLIIQCGSSEGTAGALFRTDMVVISSRFGSNQINTFNTYMNDGVSITNWSYSYDGSNFRVTQNWSAGGANLSTFWNIVNITGSSSS